MPASAKWVREGILAKYDAGNVGAKKNAKSAAGKTKSKKAAAPSKKSPSKTKKSPAKTTSGRQK
jgi:hypothetical protein